MLNGETEDVDLSVVGALVIVAHLEEGLWSVEVLLQGLECSTIKRELKSVVLIAQLIVESGTRSDRADWVQVLAFTAGCDHLNTNSNLTTMIIHLGLDWLVLTLVRYFPY